MTNHHPRLAALAVAALVAAAGCSNHTSATTPSVATTPTATTAPSVATTPSATGPTLDDPMPSPMDPASANAFPVQHMTITTSKTDANVTLDDGAAVPALTIRQAVPLNGTPAKLKQGGNCIQNATLGNLCLVRAQVANGTDKLPAVHVWLVSSKHGQCELVGSLTPGRPITRSCVETAQ